MATPILVQVVLQNHRRSSRVDSCPAIPWFPAGGNHRLLGALGRHPLVPQDNRQIDPFLGKCFDQSCGVPLYTLRLIAGIRSDQGDRS